MKRGPLSKRPFLFLLGLVLACLSVLVFSGGAKTNRGLESAQAAPLQQDLPEVYFSTTSEIVNEPDSGETSEVTFTVRISEAPAQGRAAEVNYRTVQGSGEPNVDFTPVSGTLNFPVGSTDSQTFDVTILGNNLDQPNRTFSVVLQQAVNATIGSPNTTIVTIVDNDEPPATNTPTPTPGGDVFIDRYEPNNDFDNAYTTSANADKLTDSTLWPVGDVDYFQFYGKDDSTYQVFTTDVTAGIDTFLKVYDPDGNAIAENDDIDPTNTRSQLEFTAKKTGMFYARVTNQDPSDPTNKTYSFGVNEIVPPTPTATATRIGQLDACEDNNSIDTACLIGEGQTLTGMNFIPPQGTGTDNDFYRLPVKPGILYTCETTNLSPPNDTNIIFLDNNGNDLNPPLGNDDRALGDPSSLLSWYSTYQGNLFVLVGPVNPPPYDQSPQFTYDISCSSVAATPTPPATPTVVFQPPTGSGGGPVVVPTATPIAYPTFPPTPTAIDFDNFVPTQAPPPVIDFQPLPTATPLAAVQQTTTVQVTVYFDSNFNFTPELTEGIMDVAVELYDNTTGELLAFGYTNEAGEVRFDAIASSGAVRVEVPFLNYSQVVSGASANILLRVEPRPLPSGIP